MTEIGEPLLGLAAPHLLASLDEGPTSEKVVWVELGALIDAEVERVALQSQDLGAN